MKRIYIIVNGYGRSMHLSDDGGMYNGSNGTVFYNYEQVRNLIRKEKRRWIKIAKKNRWSLENNNYPALIVSGILKR